ncbi:gamma-glutamyltransferase [Haliea sp. E17]|uniref:gamma-glutamyltransferase n=1 Tax=Haliea sp. E17 TaxID=3401576 RepID=UPI003AB0FF41
MKLPKIFLSSLLALGLVLPFTTTAEPAPGALPIIDYGERFLPEVARNGMVVGPERLASEVGLDMLRRGGNAVDAAVATGFALAVTYPRAGNLGGGGFMLIHLADGDRQVFIDYREAAPAAATRDMFLDDTGAVDKQKEYFSLQAAGVPGTVAGLLAALDKYGSLSRKEVLAPAIALAEKGYPMSFAQARDLNERAVMLAMDAAASAVFFHDDGSPYAMGDTFRQPDLAWTLRQIAERGHDGFYKGPVAAKIVDAMEKDDGIMTAKDLANYRSLEREPVRGSFHGFEVVSAPPPSSGGIHIIEMLNILEGYDLAAMGHNSANYIHHLAEAMKRAYADRSEYLGDPDFVEVPKRLTDKDYAVQLRKSIDPDKATPASEIKPGLEPVSESRDTTHFSVADAAGNVVTNTYTLNFSFGNHRVVPGTGFLLNNEMADFAAAPGTANAFGLVQGERNRIEGNKRPLSSMSPTLVLRDGKPWIATGSPGGSQIITTVLQTILNAMVFDMNIATAAMSPRVHHQWQPDTLLLEQGVSPDTLTLLLARGQPAEYTERTLGRTQSIMLRDGWLFGATDSRRPEGHVAAY